VAFHSQAVFGKCDVTVWEDVVAFYELAMKEYGAVDVVVRLTRHVLRRVISDQPVRRSPTLA
jgi:NAD(P)-dependent dehydrogenase (short-subunit alcohol dehydrogenase family)